MNVTRANTEILRVGIGPKKVIINYATVDGDVVSNGKCEFFLGQKGLHPEFRKYWEAMNKYLGAVLYINEANSKEIVQATQVDISGDERTLVKISGKLALSSNNLVPICTDNIDMETLESPYKFTEDFKMDVGVLMNEAFAYCFEDKQAQQKIVFVEGDVPGKILTYEDKEDGIEKVEKETIKVIADAKKPVADIPDVVKDLTASTVAAIEADKEKVVTEPDLFN